MKRVLKNALQPDAQVRNVAWILSNNTPLEPLVVFTVSSVITIFNVATRSVVGRLRGHGGVSRSLRQSYVHLAEQHNSSSPRYPSIRYNHISSALRLGISPRVSTMRPSSQSKCQITLTGHPFPNPALRDPHMACTCANPKERV